MTFDTRILAINAERPSEAALSEGAELLRSGELVAFATETVYGLGADATNDRAVSKIFEAKGRPSVNPLIVHVAEIADAKRFTATWPDRANRLANHFWPGPLTIVLPKSDAICRRATAGNPTVGLRVPAANVARSLIRHAERPIAAPSANRSTGLSPTKAEHVLKALSGRIPLILDSGPTSIGIESAVIDLCHESARLLRPGSLSLDEIQSILGEPVELLVKGDRNEPEILTSPGQMAVHYAPTTPTFRVEPGRSVALTESLRYGLLRFGGGTIRVNVEPGEHCVFEDPDVAARFLYSTLHEFDEARLNFILIVLPPSSAEWRAIRDRLTRASRPWPEDSCVELTEKTLLDRHP